MRQRRKQTHAVTDRRTEKKIRKWTCRQILEANRQSDEFVTEILHARHTYMHVYTYA